MPLCALYHVTLPMREMTCKLASALFNKTSCWSHACMLCQHQIVIKVFSHCFWISCPRPVIIFGWTLCSTVVVLKTQFLPVTFCLRSGRKNICLWMVKGNTWIKNKFCFQCLKYILSWAIHPLKIQKSHLGQIFTIMITKALYSIFKQPQNWD